ncbi:MAG: NAD-binding protein [Chrysiogenetes bacterium]|nr:NAD-binding protein [Chrysiogenetes bacterium]
MRVVIVGGSEVAVETAGLLTRRGHEVVVIDSNRERIDELSQVLDCSFLHGDGSKPAVLREAAPDLTHVLFCLTDQDQANIIASLVGRQLGFSRVVTRIHDKEYESICVELGLDEVIVPSQTIGRYLADMAEGARVMELSSALRGEGRLFAFVAKDTDAVAITDLALPKGTRVMCYYRNDEFCMPDGETAFHEGDEIILVTTAASLPELRERWSPVQRSNGKS